MAIAKTRGWGLASDDRKARRLAGQLGVNVVTTAELVKSWSENTKAPDDDVAQVLRRLESRVRALLKPRLEALREDARPPDALAASQAESVSVLRGKPPDQRETKHLAAYHQGFSLHAGIHLHANDRQGLARLCGYGARPPLTRSASPRFPTASSRTA